MTVEAILTTEMEDQVLATNLQQAQLIANEADANAVSNGQFVFFAAFDGTNNDAENLGNPQHTNVFQLSEQADAPGITAAYFAGPGTKEALTASSWLNPQVDAQVVRQARNAYSVFAREAKSILEDNSSASIVVALTAFSRGGGVRGYFQPDALRKRSS
jgi:hypothetical protein